jgi:thiamine biosynthesis lipoprotein
MARIEFEALGTHWEIIADSDVSWIEDDVFDFEKKYSRFDDDSLVSQINNGQLGSEIKIDQELCEMLELGKQLEKTCDGYFNLNIARTLESYGYDKDLSFVGRLGSNTKDWSSGKWEIKRGKLLLEEGVRLDLGAVGKGYLVDKLAKRLRDEGSVDFLVNAGGDVMMGTVPKKVAIENPVSSSEYISVVEVFDKCVMTSSGEKRKVGSFHHLIDGKTRKPASYLLQASVISDNAAVADGVATAMMVSPYEYTHRLFEQFDVAYLLVTQDMKMIKSKNWRA